MSCHGNRIFIAVGVFPLKPAMFQWSVMQISHDSFLDVPHIILG